jgi:hypothetical protein
MSLTRRVGALAPENPAINDKEQLTTMKHIRIIGLVLVALFMMSVIAASAAFAEPEHIYKVNGAKLEAGKTQEITSKVKPGTEFVLKGTGPLGIKSETKCKKLKLAVAEKPVIVGGTPGKSEKEKIEFEECTATVGGAKCEKVTIESASTNNELVTIDLPAGKAGKLATLFTPVAGKVFTTIKLTKCGIFGSQEAKVEGTSAALVSPEKVEAESGTLVWKEAEEITEVQNQNKEKKKIGLIFNGKAATINGEAEVTLVSKEKWGAF